MLRIVCQPIAKVLVMLTALDGRHERHLMRQRGAGYVDSIAHPSDS